MKHSLQVVFEEAQVPGVRSYSGRGMFGKECLGVDIDCGKLGNFIARVIQGMQCQEGAENIDALTEAFEHMAQDQMGKGIIVYFPDVPFTADEEGEG